MSKARNLVRTGICAVLSVSVALLFVHIYNTSPGEFSASYTFAVPEVWGCLGIALGLTLLCLRKARGTGISILIGGMLLPCVFFAGIRVSLTKGWVLWANEPMQVIWGGVGSQASEVVYYIPGVTQAQMESFERGAFDSNADTSYFVRLSPSQAYGHDAFAIGLSPSVSEVRRKQIRLALSQSPLVFRVYDDVAPRDIPAP